MLHSVPGILGGNCMIKYVGNIRILVHLTNVKFWRRTLPTYNLVEFEKVDIGYFTKSVLSIDS